MFKWNGDAHTGLGRETTGRQKIRNVRFIEQRKINNVDRQIHGK